MTDIQKKAYKDYVKGMKAADIAKKYDVPAATVRTWINRKWKEKNVSSSAEKVETKNSKNLKRKGAPKGNKNAVGNSGGAPERNQNNFKHGAYCGFFADVMTDEERAHMSGQKLDLEQKYIEEIKISDILEKRLLKQIDRYQSDYQLDDEKISILTGLTRITRVSGIKGEKDSEEVNKKPYEQELIKDTNPAYLHLKVLGEQLVKNRAEKNKALKNLADLQMKKAEFDLKKKTVEKVDDQVADDDWIAATLENE